MIYILFIGKASGVNLKFINTCLLYALLVLASWDYLIKLDFYSDGNTSSISITEVKHLELNPFSAG